MTSWEQHIWINQAIWSSGREKKQSTTLNYIERLTNNALRIICFKSKYIAVNQAYEKLKILKFGDMLTLNNVNSYMIILIENYR